MRQSDDCRLNVLIRVKMSTKSITLHPIGSDQIEDVRRLAMDIWPKAYRNIIGPDKVDQMLADLYSYEALEAEMNEGHQFWIARHNDFDVAYASAYQDGDRLWLRKLYCRQEFRGLSIGMMLMDEAIKTFPKARSLGLNVNKDNEPAISYYKKHGFVVEAEVPVVMGAFHFQDLVMSKSINHH